MGTLHFFCAPDPISNQDIAPGTITPPGYFFTRIGVHSYVNNFPPAGDIIPTVTPNTSTPEIQVRQCFSFTGNMEGDFDQIYNTKQI